MPEYVVYEFGIDIYRDQEYQGTNYIDIEIDKDDAVILGLLACKKEGLLVQSILADVYALVYQKVYEQEVKKCCDHEYPYYGISAFEDYSLKIFV